MATKKTSETKNTEKEIKKTSRTTAKSSDKKLTKEASATASTSKKTSSRAAEARTTKKATSTGQAASTAKKTTAKTTTKGSSKSSAGAKTAAPKATPKTKRSTVARSKRGTSDVEEREIHEETIVPQAATEVREHYFQEHRSAPPMPHIPDLPSEYGDTKIVLLVRDPEWVFAYWEINDAVRAEYGLPREGHNRRMVIRMYNITGRQWPEDKAHYFFEIDISPYANNWYIKLPEADQQWVAELGVYDERGEYLPIVQSNVVRTPRDRMSEETDADWMVVEETWQKIYGMSGAMRPLDSSWGGSEELLRHLQKQVYPALRGEGSFGGSGALGSAGIGAPTPAAVQAPSAFWLRTETELILYGATESDATVSVNGEKVQLYPDGTFSLRFALPDGSQRLDVRATSHDGNHEREISIVVKKVTK